MKMEKEKVEVGTLLNPTRIKSNKNASKICVLTPNKML